MIRVIRARLLLEDTASGALLDGFPRTLPQAQALDGLLEELDRALALVIDLEIPELVAVRRLLARAREQGRRDDTPDVIRHRLDVYDHETAPLIGYYRERGLLAVVNAEGTEDEVFAEVRKALEPTGIFAVGPEAAQPVTVDTS